MTLRIACGDSLCSLLPQAGGSIGGWRVNGQEMFRSALDENDPLKSASFPLVPYSNRIADARFDWNGEKVQLVADDLSSPHAIHGLGWKRPWEVREAGADFATLILCHSPDANWPWPFAAEQKFSVDEASLSVKMTARNLADWAVPLAFGHHPYFESGGATLTFEASAFLPTGEHSLPAEQVAIGPAHNFSNGLAVSSIELDDQFAGWTGTSEIRWEGRPLGLRITSNLSHAVVFTPSAADFFCFEPVPHLTNALNRGDGDMPVIEPGESFTAQIRFEAIGPL
jgi:aldose 1-epimerase